VDLDCEPSDDPGLCLSEGLPHAAPMIRLQGGKGLSGGVHTGAPPHARGPTHARVSSWDSVRKSRAAHLSSRDTWDTPPSAAGSQAYTVLRSTHSSHPACPPLPCLQAVSMLGEGEWRYFQFNVGAFGAATTILLQQGKSCSSLEQPLGSFLTLDECAAPCDTLPGCRHFTYANAGGPMRQCVVESARRGLSTRQSTFTCSLPRPEASPSPSRPRMEIRTA
jgi:hypothetical protein